jgi:hypothetical protein
LHLASIVEIDADQMGTLHSDGMLADVGRKLARASLTLNAVELCRAH